MLTISWSEKKSNLEVVSEAGVLKTSMKRIRQQQLDFRGGHIMRSNGLENRCSVVTGKI